jgi:hypothetical protein
VTVRVRFGDLHSVTRAVTLEAPISATAILAEIAEELVRAVLSDYPDERMISLLAISVSHLEEHWDLQLELPLGLEDERRRPGTRQGMARWMADVPLIGSAIVSGGMRSDMGPPRWNSPDPFRTSFANWPKRIFDQCIS